jgi:hypothetical protein
MSDQRHATLYIDDEPVGDVVAKRGGASWSHGDFRPNPAFVKFAPIFGEWSLLMHADGAYKRLSRATSEGLRQVEFELDRLHAELQFVEGGEWVACSQLNIDGEMIEWKAF